ncbi:MAG TPA: hypothetical protein VJM31_15165 [Vicinamibacterales bacterium]|nr:hypothetical protein [Vicinamibacterales bacterium]
MNPHVVEHLFSAVHGIAAGLASCAVFQVAGLLLLPRRWGASIDGFGAALIGAGFYVVLCWIAIGARNMPLIYVIFAFAALLCLLASVRLGWLQSAVKVRLASPATGRSALAFCAFYALTYVLIMPPTGGTYLPLAPSGNVDLVTYARYAQHVLEQGIPGLSYAAFGYLDSPASTYLLAWQSIWFGRDPLTAALPTLFAVVALFGVIAAEVSRSVFGLSTRTSMAVACVTLTSPFFRWIASGYALSTLLMVTVLLYLAWLVSRVAISRVMDGPIVAAFVGACVFLWFVQPLSPAWVGRTATATAIVAGSVSPLTILGWPGRLIQPENIGVARAGALTILPLVPLVWASLLYGLRHGIASTRTVMSEDDRHLTMALAGYVTVAFIIGNVAVDAASDPGASRVSARWHDLKEVNRLPFRAVTLKMDDPPDGLRTSLALYFLPTKKATVIGPDVNLKDLPLDTVSKSAPMFIQNFGCQGVGHDNTLSIRGIGCLTFSPPSIKLGKTYPFSHTFLFMSYEDMARSSGGRLSTRATLPLKLTADPEITPVNRDLYVNLLVNPVLPAGGKPQRMIFNWGSDRHGEASLADVGWISFPVRSNDWTGNRLWTLAVEIEFPDRRRMLFQELSVTETPSGRLLEPALAGAH